MAENLRVLFSWNGIDYKSDDLIFDGYVAGIGDGVLLEDHLDILYREVERQQKAVSFSPGKDIEMSISPGGRTEMYDKNKKVKAVHIDKIPKLVNRIKNQKLMEELF